MDFSWARKSVAAVGWSKFTFCILIVVWLLQKLLLVARGPFSNRLCDLPGICGGLRLMPSEEELSIFSDRAHLSFFLSGTAGLRVNCGTHSNSGGKSISIIRGSSSSISSFNDSSEIYANDAVFFLSESFAKGLSLLFIRCIG